MFCILTVSFLDTFTDAEVLFLRHWIRHVISVWSYISRMWQRCWQVHDLHLVSDTDPLLIIAHSSLVLIYETHTQFYPFRPRFQPQVDNNSADSSPVEKETIRLMVAIAMPLLHHYDTTLPTLCLLLPVNVFSREFSRQGANFGLNKLASPVQYRSWDVSSY